MADIYGNSAAGHGGRAAATARIMRAHGGHDPRMNGARRPA